MSNHRLVYINIKCNKGKQNIYFDQALILQNLLEMGKGEEKDRNKNNYVSFSVHSKTSLNLSFKEIHIYGLSSIKIFIESMLSIFQIYMKN